MVIKGVRTKRLTQLVQERGLDFEITESYLSALQGEGAKRSLLDALRAARRFPAEKFSLGGCGSGSGFTVVDFNEPGKGIIPPFPVYKPAPPYPKEARDAKLEGEVTLCVVVDAEGHVTDAKPVLKPLGMGLEESATKTVLTWKFKPGSRDGIPLPVVIAIEVAFRLF
jgi:TonB family protein